jgi:DNA repair exonuclease SbcCD ATPase subunit
MQEMLFSSAVKPDPEVYTKLNEKLKEKKSLAENAHKLVASAMSNLNISKKMLSTLDNPVACPISPKLTCNTDKSPLRDELTKIVNDLEEEIKKLNENSEKIKSEIASTESRIDEYNKNKNDYDKLIFIRNSIAELEKQVIIIPDEPTLPIKTSYATEKKEIEDSLAMIRTYKETEMYYSKWLRAKRNVLMTKYIINVFDDGGLVKSKFMKETVEVLESICNENAEVFDPDFSVKLEIDDGIKAKFKFNNVYLPYKALSTGEKIIAMLVITNAVNEYIGSEILIIDETNDLDEDNFRKLIHYIKDEASTESYNNIILCCVNHEGLMKILEDEGGVEVIKLDEKKTK